MKLAARRTDWHRRCRCLGGAVVLAAALVVALGTPVPAATSSSPAAAECLITGTNIRVGPASGVPDLKLTSSSVSKTTARTAAPLPTHVGQGPESPAKFVGKDCPIPNETEVRFTYDISGTKYSMSAHVRVPIFTNNEISCDILENGVPVATSPYV